MGSVTKAQCEPPHL